MLVILDPTDTMTFHEKIDVDAIFVMLQYILEDVSGVQIIEKQIM